MNPYAIFKEFFRREGIYYLIGLTMLIAIDVAFLIVPQLIGSAIDTLSHNKEGLTLYILYFIGLLIIITVLKVISRRTLLGSIRRMEYLFRQKLCARALEIPTTYYDVNGPGKVSPTPTICPRAWSSCWTRSSVPHWALPPPKTPAPKAAASFAPTALPA